MKLFFIITTISFALVSGDEWGLVHFSKSFYTLHFCLRNSPLWKDIGFRVNASIIRATADSFAGRLSLETKSTKYIRERAIKLMDDLISRGFIKNSSDTEFMKKFINTIEKVIEDCSDQRNNNGKLFDRHEVPFFNSHTELEPLLNLILVNWQPSLRAVLSTSSGRAILRRYAEQALNIFELFYTRSFRYFEIILRRGWDMRARIFFDGRNEFRPYINYIYSMDLETPYTLDSPNEFVNRRNEDFNIRNPPASQSEIETVLSTLEICHNFRIEYDSFPHYVSHRMTSSDYYFEIHLIQFYQILFLYLEMLERGIDDDHDTWDGPIPYGVLPEPIQAIAYNYTAYQDYLIQSVNETPISEYTENILRRDFELWARFREANMILDRWAHIRSTRSTTLTTTSTTTPVDEDSIDEEEEELTSSSTTTLTTSSHINTSPKNFESKKGKGLIMRGSMSGKCFTANRNQCDSSQKRSESLSSSQNSKYLEGTDRYVDYEYYLTNTVSDEATTAEELNFLTELLHNFLIEPILHDFSCR